MKITNAGLRQLHNQLKDLEDKMKIIQKKKSEALDLGGGWHDNASYDQFLDEERFLFAEIEQIRKDISEAELVNYDNSNLGVQIGSVVEIDFGNGLSKEYKIYEARCFYK